MSESFRIVRRVEFGDTDMAGIVHFSNFFRYMEVAETAFLRSHGYSVSMDYEGVRVGFPRVAVSCNFFKPARFEDELEIQVVITKLGRKSLSYRFDFMCGGELIARGEMTSVFCRKTPTMEIESLEIPDALREKLVTSLLKI